MSMTYIINRSSVTIPQQHHKNIRRSEICGFSEGDPISENRPRTVTLNSECEGVGVGVGLKAGQSVGVVRHSQ